MKGFGKSQNTVLIIMEIDSSYKHYDKMDEDETYFINQNAFLNLIQDLTFPKNDPLPPTMTNPNR